MSEAWDEAYAGMTLEGIDTSISFLIEGQYLRLPGIGIDDSQDASGISEATALARDCHAMQTAGSPGADVPIPQADDVPEPGTGTTIGIEDGGALGTPVPKPSPQETGPGRYPGPVVCRHRWQGKAYSAASM